MNREQFQALIWLRWRLRLNQLRRAGPLSGALTVLLASLAVIFDASLLVISFLVGWLALAGVEPVVTMFIWDALIAAFLLFWMVGLITALQRADAMSLDKFMHLPVSLAGAFLINYLGSLVNLTLLIFLPVMLGLSLGLMVGQGLGALVLVPLVVSFVLMVTALTYQFQGWLASLMENKRRRRTIVLLLTMSLVLVAQVPNLANMYWLAHGLDQGLSEVGDAQTKLADDLAARNITPDEYETRVKALWQEYATAQAEKNRQQWQQVAEVGRLANLFLPPGWLALGAMGTAEARVVPGLLGSLGLAAIGVFSLWRSYRTTLRIYTGQFKSGRRAPKPAAPTSQPVHATAPFLERKLFWLSEQASVVALATFRAQWRSPEIKMVVLSSLLMVAIFGSMFARGLTAASDVSRGLLRFGLMAFVLFGMLQLVSNQFGYDRNGFQVYVLSGIRRRDILLGKNLALAPLPLGLGLLATAIMQVVLPTGLDYLLAAPAQFLSMYLLFCLLCNLLSIFAPVRVAVGSLRASQPGLVAVLLQLLSLFVFFPLAMLPLLLPFGIRGMLDQLELPAAIPVCALLSWLECLVVVLLYRAGLNWQGNLLQAGELRILDVVKTKAER